MRMISFLVSHYDMSWYYIPVFYKSNSHNKDSGERVKIQEQDKSYKTHIVMV